MRLGPVRVMVAGVVIMLCVEEVSYLLRMCTPLHGQLGIVKTEFLERE